MTDTAFNNPQNDPLMSVLLSVAAHYHIDCSATAIKSGLPLSNDQLTPKLFSRAAKQAGLKASVKKKSLDAIADAILPIIVLLKDNKAVVVYQFDRENQKILVSLGNEPQWVDADSISKQKTGFVILLKPLEKFDESVARLASDTIKRKHWFWSVIFDSKRIYRDVLVAALFINLFALANPLFVMNVYDRVVPNNAMETLWVLAIGVTIAYSFDLLLRLLRGYFIEVAGKKSDILLSAYLFEKVLGAQFSEKPSSTGAFVSQLREFDTVRQFFAASAITTLIDLPFLFLFLVVIYYIGGALVYVPLAALPVILLITLVMQRPIKAAVDQTFVSSAQKNATLVETIVGLETVKVLRAEGFLQHKWEQSVGHLAKWSQRTRLLSLGVNSFAAFVQQIAAVILVIVGVYLIADKTLTMGALIACVILSGRALAPMAQVANLIVNYDQTKTALASLDAIANKPQERNTETPYVARNQIEGSVSFKDLSFCYPNDKQPALSGVSFSIKAGEKVAVIGRIGSGKSTIQKLILGLHKPTNGSVLVDGVDLEQIDPADLRRHVNYVPQQVVLFTGSIKSNITYGKSGVGDDDILKASELAGVDRFVNQHQLGFDRQVGERGEALSGGQRQSIGLARAMLSPSNIMLLDEPTNGMDNSSESVVLANFSELAKEQTLILVTHKTSLLSLVDRVLVLDQGKLIADGPKDSVLEALRRGQLRVG